MRNHLKSARGKRQSQMYHWDEMVTFALLPLSGLESGEKHQTDCGKTNDDRRSVRYPPSTQDFFNGGESFMSVPLSG